MNDEQDRLMDLFNEARAKGSAAEREAYLRSACGGDAVLRQRVEKLLRAYEEAGDFLVQPVGPAGGEVRPEACGSVIGRYKLLQEIGEGAFGVVYMAEQTEPVERKVALKIIKAGMDTRAVIARFEAERQALALMDHPNIAKVLDAGTTDASASQPSTLNSQLHLGRPYFVMELVKGLPITTYSDKYDLSTEDRLRLFMEVCHGVQHAHQKGIIHRDLKPTNILVTVIDAEPVPKIIDFGVAKALGHKLTDKTLFTAFEQIIGTPAYMSPEQAELSGVDIDTRSDIYALGVLLYELLTGVTPFDKETLAKAALDEVRRIIRETEPPKPSTRLSELARRQKAEGGGQKSEVGGQWSVVSGQRWKEVHGDLDWIVMKALEKDRRRRYETAGAFAEDVQRHAEHQPVLARPPSAAYRTRKFVRRHRMGVALAASVTVALITGLVVSLIGFKQARTERDRAVEAETEAEKQQVRAEQMRAAAEQNQTTAEDRARQISYQLYASEMNRGLKAWQNGDLAGALSVLNRCRPQTGQGDLRGFEWYYLWRLCHSEQLALFGHSNLVRAVAFSPDGQLLASGGDDGYARLWNAVTGEEVAVLDGHTNGVSAVAFSPDGTTIATGGRDGLVRVWEAGTFKERLVLGKLTNAVGAVAFSPDGRWLAAGSAIVTAAGSGTPSTRFIDVSPFAADLKLWEMPNGREFLSLRGHTAGIHALAFAPDGKSLASASVAGEAFIWDLPEVAQRKVQDRFVVPLLALGFSPSGDALALGGGEMRNRETFLKILDPKTGREKASLKGHRGAVFALAFSPDGETLATGGQDQTVRLWDVATGTELRAIKGHTASIWSLAFDPAGRQLATASWDKSVKIWAAKRRQEFRAFPGFPNYSVEFSPDSQWLAGGGPGVALLKVGSGEPAFCLPGYYNADCLVAWSPDGKLLAAAGEDKLVTVWETGSWRKWAVFEGHQGTIRSLAFSPDSRTLASGAFLGDMTVRLWDVSDRRERAVARLHTLPIEGLAFTPEGRSLLAGSGAEIVSVNPLNGQEQWRLGEPGAELPISPDGRWMALVDPDLFSLRLMDLASKEVKWTTRAHNDVIYDATFSPDGKTIATASWDRTAMLWSAATGQELFRYESPGVAWAVAFSPDGRHWAVGYSGGGVSLFQTVTQAGISAPLRSSDPVRALRSEPEDNETWRLRAEGLAAMGDEVGALAVYDRVIQQHPGDAAAYRGKAMWLAKKARLEEAARVLAQAAQVAEADTTGQGLMLNRAAQGLADAGLLLKARGSDEAEPALRQVLGLANRLWGEASSTTCDLRINLAEFYFDRGRYKDAEVLYLEELELHPETREVGRRFLVPFRRPPLWYLAQCLVKLYEVSGQPEKIPLLRTKVTQYYHQAVEKLRRGAAEGNLDALDQLAWLLATCEEDAIRDGTAAVDFAEKAVAFTSRTYAPYLTTLAAAYAETGQFEKAAATQKEAINLMKVEKEKDYYAARLRIYASGRPYRD